MMTASAQIEQTPEIVPAEILCFESAVNRLMRSRGGVTSMATIMRRICKATGVSKEQIVGPSRSRQIVFARHAIIYWARRLTVLSQMEIGRRVGRPDHKTIHHAVDAYPVKRQRMGRNVRPIPRQAGLPAVKKLGRRHLILQR